MKRFFRNLFLVIFSIVLLSSCNTNTKTEIKDENVHNDKKVLKIFAAASMTETLEKVKTIYEKENANVELIYTFDSSGTLKKQIEQGADVDIFISASSKQMNALDKTKNPEAKVFIAENSRINLLENKVALVTQKEKETDIKTFSDLVNPKIEKIALGNSDVPVGQYSKEILDNLGIFKNIESKITYGSNVKEVTTWVKEGVCDFGIVYSTDAYSAELKVLDTAKEDMMKTRVEYPIAILENSKSKRLAGDFIEYLKNDNCKAIFEEVGFSMAK